VQDVLTILFAFAGAAAAALIIARFSRADPAELLGRRPLDTGPGEPCWTEEIGREGALSLGRGQCVDDMLMELDRRAARGEFPVGELNTGGG
jgi:hypothetical protein